MDITDRLNAFIRYAVRGRLVANRSELGARMGYSNASAFSQVVNGLKPLPKDFIDRFSKLFPELDSHWLLTGEGEMLKKTGAMAGGTPASTASSVPGAVTAADLLDLLKAEKAEKAKLAAALADANAALLRSAEALASLVARTTNGDN